MKTHHRTEAAFDKEKFLKRHPNFVVTYDKMPEMKVVLPVNLHSILVIEETLADDKRLMAVEVSYKGEKWFKASYLAQTALPRRGAHAQ